MAKNSVNRDALSIQNRALKSSRSVSQTAINNANAITNINQEILQEISASFQEKIFSLLKMQDPRSAFDFIQAEILQDAAKEVAKYQNKIAEILEDGNKELSGMAYILIQESKNDLINFINAATASTPIKAESYVSIFKSAFNTALQNFELIRAATADSFSNFEKSVDNVSNLTNVSIGNAKKVEKRVKK